MKHELLLVTPALADANNGNWQTARRWSQMLAADYRVRLSQAWDGEPADVLLALHARRSADAVFAFAKACPGKPIVLALTGTDLYRDIQSDKSAQRAMKAATRLIVLQPAGLEALPTPYKAKARVCEQSLALPPALRAAVDKPTDRLRAVMVGHLRAEKDPATVFAAARLLQQRMDIKLLHIGRSLEPALGQAAEALSIEDGAYGWLGELPHEEVLAHIRRAHVLVHPSVLEGGAHAVIEAVRCGTPVLASRIPGNVGLLGDDYEGYFPVGDAPALAALLQRVRDDASFLQRLAHQCAKRATRFSPRREKATLRAILAETLSASAPVAAD